MLGALLAVALNAAPVPNADVSQLDQAQLLQLYEQIDRSLPARWPGVAAMGGGGVGLIFSGLIAMFSGIFVLAAEKMPEQYGNFRPGADYALMVAGVGAALSAITLTIGIIVFKVASNRRTEYQATLSAIDERLDALEQGTAAPAVPPPPEAPPSRTGSGSLRAVPLDALTQKPVPHVTVRIDGRALDGLEADGLEPGPHELVASCEGYREAKEYARVIAGRRVFVTLKLVPDGQEAPARLSGLVRSAVDGKPLSAWVEVDGTPHPTDARGIFSIVLPPAAHSVRVFAAGFVAQLRRLELKEGARVILNVDLQAGAP